MTAPDPRLGEIEARLNAALNEPENNKAQLAYMVRSTADVAYLLAELRGAREALGRVEALHQAEHIDVPIWQSGYKSGGNKCALDGQSWPCETTAAVAASGGGGE